MGPHRAVVLAALGAIGSPLAAQYELVEQMPIALDYGAMAFDAARGEAIYFGGRDSFFVNQYGVDRTYAWDGSRWRPRTPAHRPPPRFGACLAYDPLRQRVVLFGGQGPGNGAGAARVFGDTWEWDGADWSVIPVSGPPARWHSAMVFDGRVGEMILFGGTNDPASSPSQEFGDAWIYNGSRWLNLPLPSPSPVARPFPRAGHSLVFDQARGVTVLWGGEGYNNNADGDVWEIGAAGFRRIRATGPTPRVDAVLCDVPGVGVMLHGGSSYRTGPPLPADSWLWDGVRWSPIATAQPEPAARMASCFDAQRGEVVICGGAQQDGWPRLRQATWTFAGSWTEHAFPTPDFVSNTCFDAARGRLWFHTHAPWSPSAVQTMWTRTAAGWTRATPATLPPVRLSDVDWVFDRRRQVATLFGGRGANGAFLADTWSWDGSTWIQQLPVISPSARDGHALAYDRGRARIVLFGGYVPAGSAVGYLGDTWEFDGSAWRQAAPAVAPPPRQPEARAMAYDVRTAEVVLFGGRDANGRRTDTWTWNGSVWRALPASTPNPQRGRLLEDDDRGQVVLVSNAGMQLETWDFTGNGWRSTGSLQAPAYTPGLVYDGSRGRIVTVGDGQYELALPTASLSAGGNPLVLQLSGRPALGGQVQLSLAAPGLVVAATAPALVPGAVLSGPPWCGAATAFVDPTQVQSLGFGTNVNLTVPNLTALRDLPVCLQAVGLTGSCLDLSNAWTLRIQGS